MKTKKIGLIVGSLRKDSFNRKIAQTLIQISESDLQFEFIAIDDLPLYNQDLDSTPPKSWITFREQVQSCAGIVFITPEYNRSIPGALKNALDIGSRPYGQSAWEKKPAAVISVSTGAIGGFGANHHLRQSLVFLDMPTMPQPEMYIGNVGKLFNEKNEITDPKLIERLKEFSFALGQWLNSLLPEEMGTYAHSEEQIIWPQY